MSHPDGCWIWVASVDRRGYGRIQGGGRRAGVLGAHRASWIIHFGAIPDGLHVLHHCDNPPCVNPAHLFLGTPKDNVADMRAKGRYVGNPDGKGIKRGAGSPNAKVTEGDVVAIRAERERGVPVAALSERYGVSRSLVSEIANRKAWAHVR